MRSEVYLDNAVSCTGLSCGAVTISQTDSVNWEASLATPANNQDLMLMLEGPGRVTWTQFLTESNSDRITIGGQSYSGSVPPGV